jgi:transposase
MKSKYTLSDYDRWSKPCNHCGCDNGKLGKNSEFRCWKCGRKLERDYSEPCFEKESYIG